MTYPAARARQLTALEAHKVRASPPRVHPDCNLGPLNTHARPKPGAFLTLTNRLTRPFPPFPDDFHRLRRPRRGSPAEKRDAHSP